MTPEQIYNQIVHDFELQGLTDADKDEMILQIGAAIQKQFLLDVYEKIGGDQLNALQASVQMGEAFYETTLKHLVPEYEDLFQSARQKVLTEYKKAA